MIYLLTVSILWALSFGLIKQNLAGVDPAFVAAVRLVLSLLVFLPFFPWRAGTRPLLTLAALGAVQFGLMYFFYLSAFPYLKAGEVALFTIFTPLLVTLLDDLLELRFSWLFFSAALLAVAGTALCLGPGIVRPELHRGFVLVQLSNACFALGQVLYRRLPAAWTARDREAMSGLYLGAALIAVILAAVSTGGALPTLTARQLWVLLYLGVIASGLGFFLWNAGARRTNVGALAVMNNAKIPLGMLASTLVFGETLSVGWPWLAAGGTVIAAALLLNELALRRRRSPAEQRRD
jgi:drug/metabolite transporter (DMT)-like permease